MPRSGIPGVACSLSLGRVWMHTVSYRFWSAMEEFRGLYDFLCDVFQHANYVHRATFATWK